LLSGWTLTKTFFLFDNANPISILRDEIHYHQKGKKQILFFFVSNKILYGDPGKKSTPGVVIAMQNFGEFLRFNHPQLNSDYGRLFP